MDIQQVADVLVTIVLLIGFAGLGKLWALYTLDDFRQKLFEIRDELFDFAADGNIGFDDPAYVLMRRRINGLIRHGHDITPMRLLLHSAMLKVSPSPIADWTSDWNKALCSVPTPHAKHKLMIIQGKTTQRVGVRLAFSSPILLIMLAIAGLYYMCVSGATSFKNTLIRAARLVMIGPIDPRLIQEDGICF